MRSAHRRMLGVVAMCLVVISTSAAPAGAAGGRLDRTFGRDGRATAFPKGATGYGVAIDAQGRIVLAGYTLDGDPDLALARFRSNGTLDRDFGGGDGRVSTDLGGTDYGFDLSMAAGGRIVVVGERARRSGTMMVVAVFGPREGSTTTSRPTASRSSASTRSSRERTPSS